MHISHYSTVSGFVMDQLKAMPHEGDIVEHENFKFEIVEMDGLRMNQVLMSKLV
jgi:putative hemolysin